MFKRVLGLMLAAAVAMCIVGTTGCGDSSDETLTKAEFVKQGNAICEKAEEKRGEIFSAESERFNPKGDVPAQQEKLVVKTIPTYQQAAEQLGELGAPEDSADKLEGLVAAMEEAAQQVEADPHTAIVSNVQFKNANKLAEELKLKSCVI